MKTFVEEIEKDENSNYWVRMVGFASGEIIARKRP
jgi:hypothetical protein